MDASNVMPEGKNPDSPTIGLGEPEVVTLNEPSAPTPRITLLALVIAGASFTVNVKFRVASFPTPLSAVKVTR